MTEKYYFPFGQELKKVEQENRSPKKAFVLGVYASAVHAKWTDNDGNQVVSALAVASEPEIFWTGHDADKIISAIQIPEQLGKLSVPGNKRLNGPSGRALDESFLSPLDIKRKDTWLCDLLPYSRVNEKQRQAITDHYTKEIVKDFNLTPASIPDFDKGELNSKPRRDEILEELEMSQAKILILLGDLPIYWFLRFHDKRYSRLSQFGETYETYGRQHDIRINNRLYKVIPLCHPRQAARLGSSNSKWGDLHDKWINRQKDSKRFA